MIELSTMIMMKGIIKVIIMSMLAMTLSNADSSETQNPLNPCIGRMVDVQMAKVYNIMAKMAREATTHL